MKSYWLLFFCLFTFTFLLLPSQAYAAATLSFSPASKTVINNETFNVDVVLNTGGSESDGADVIVRYDGNKLNLVSAALANLYANKLTADTSTAGKITFRATSTESASFNGTGTFATISLQAKAEGTANLYFDFTSGSTTDSNVAYRGSDILGSVSNASFAITSSGGGGVPASPSIPVSGTASPTILVLGGGLLMLILGAVKLLFFKSL